MKNKHKQLFSMLLTTEIFDLIQKNHWIEKSKKKKKNWGKKWRLIDLGWYNHITNIHYKIQDKIYCEPITI